MTDSTIYAICGDIINISNTLVLESQTIEISGNFKFNKKIIENVNISENLIIDTSINVYENNMLYNTKMIDYTRDETYNNAFGNGIYLHPYNDILAIGQPGTDRWASPALHYDAGIIYIYDISNNTTTLHPDGPTGQSIWETNNPGRRGSGRQGCANTFFLTLSNELFVLSKHIKSSTGLDNNGFYGVIWSTYSSGTVTNSIPHSVHVTGDSDVNPGWTLGNHPYAFDIRFHGSDDGNIFILHSTTSIAKEILYGTKGLRIYESSGNKFENNHVTETTSVSYVGSSNIIRDYWTTDINHNLSDTTTGLVTPGTGVSSYAAGVNLDTDKHIYCSHISPNGNYVAYGINQDNIQTGKIEILKRISYQNWSNVSTIYGKKNYELFGSHFVFNYDGSIIATSNSRYTYSTNNTNVYDYNSNNSNNTFTRIFQRSIIGAEISYNQIGSDISGYGVQISRTNNTIVNISSDSEYINFYKYTNNNWEKNGYSIKHELTLNSDTLFQLSINHDATTIVISNSRARGGANTDYDYHGIVKIFKRSIDGNFEEKLFNIGNYNVSNYSNGTFPVGNTNTNTVERRMQLNLHNFV